MKSSALLQHIGIAMLLTLLAMLNELIFRQFFTELFSARLNIACIIFLYLVYLIWQSHIGAGKLSLFLINPSVLLSCLLSSQATLTVMLIGLFLIWLNRLLLCYSSVLAVLVDFGLCLFSAFVVYCLLLNGHSLITALWCLLLLQSLHCLTAKKGFRKPQTLSGDNFDQALQSAENALQQLIR